MAGIGNTRDGLHPVQQRLVECHGSQCGFCTPGFAMSMYAALRSSKTSMEAEDVEEALAGNLWCEGQRRVLPSKIAHVSVDVDGLLAFDYAFRTYFLKAPLGQTRWQ